MAGTTIAYSEITILDLIDTATYIYYSANENGTGASTAPDANTKYIGIYSGPTLEGGQPLIPPEDTVWSKYVGEDGAPGSSITIKSTKVKYIVTEEDKQPNMAADWQDSIPTVPQGFYLWTWTRVVYSDNSSTDTFSKSYLGKDANAYYIESSQETVLVFLTKKGRETSPEVLQIALYEMPFNSNSEKINFAQNYEFGYINEENVFQSLTPKEGCTVGNYITDIFQEFDDGKVYYEYSSDGYYFQTEDESPNPEKAYYILEPNTENILFFKVQDFLNRQIDGDYEFDSNLLLKFAYIQNNEEVAIKIIPIRDGVSSEMAQFNIEATKINAAVRGSFLEFDETGLSLRLTSEGQPNQGLKIYRDEEKIFWADEGGNLHLKGKLEAATGSFTGTIHATEASFEKGEIGGFKIGANSLTSEDGGIILNGTQGTIKASSIELGKGATIESYIQLGNARLYNPDYELAGGRVFTSGQISIKDDGTANFGKISIDGENSRIQGSNWEITPQAAAFNNINISGAINTAVFNYETTQAVGSTMLFMPSYKIVDIDPLENQSESQSTEQAGSRIILEQAVDIKQGTKVWLVNNNNYEAGEVLSCNEKEVVLTEKVVKNDATVLIVIGNSDALIIGINSGKTKAAKHIYPRGLTINKYGNYDNLPNLFLGDLTELGNEYFGYGLYSDNVYLNGSLTTQVGNSSYAGINTLSSVRAEIFIEYVVTKDITPQENKTYYIKNDEKYEAQVLTSFEDGITYYEQIGDDSEIVFWAGAKSKKDIGIQEAPFQVTENGSIYASRAKLTSSLFVGGEIRGTDIYTARIHGTGNPKDPALTIYDTSSGISFRTGYKNDQSSSGIEIFSIQNTGLKVGENEIISINNSEVIFSGDRIQTKGTSNYLSLTTKDLIPVLYHEHSAAQSCGFYFDNGKTSYKLTSGEGKNKIDNTKMIWSSGEVKILGTIGFAKEENDSKFQYRPIDKGYDLYITY